MNQGLKNMSIVLMVGQKEGRKPMAMPSASAERNRNGKKGTRTSLIAGKSAPPALRFPQRKDGASRGKELLAPVLFKGSTNALWFNQWLEEHLIPELKPNSTLILDNAAFHRKDDVFRIAKQTGHKVLFLPPYSPDFNRIEQDFAILKKRRIYSAPGTSLDDIVKSYGNYLE